MKTQLCALASGLALAFTGAAAFAGSTASTYQNGYNNDAAITQAYNGNATAKIVQEDALNVAKADQSNNWFGTAKIDIYQNGYRNFADAQQSYTMNSDSKIVQVGDLNVAKTKQTWGANQMSDIYQQGCNNTANVTQTGSNLSATAVQIGYQNVSTITQTGW